VPQHTTHCRNICQAHTLGVADCCRFESAQRCTTRPFSMSVGKRCTPLTHCVQTSSHTCETRHGFMANPAIIFKQYGLPNSIIPGASRLHKQITPVRLRTYWYTLLCLIYTLGCQTPLLQVLPISHTVSRQTNNTCETRHDFMVHPANFLLNIMGCQTTYSQVLPISHTVSRQITPASLGTVLWYTLQGFLKLWVANSISQVPISRTVWLPNQPKHVLVWLMWQDSS